MRRFWGLLKAWHKAALTEYMTKHRTQYGSGAVTTKRQP
jgi:hypothetical protein